MNVYEIIGVVLAYFVGCFQTSFIIGKLFKKIDIRDYGSGNAGTTNAFRVMGKKAGIATFIGDFSKSLIVYLLAYSFFKDVGTAFFISFFVVLGHNWPVFLSFKGGKGIASTLGIIFAYNWKLGIILFVAGVLMVFIFKYVSLASMTVTFLFPVSLIILKETGFVILTAFILFVIAVYRHRANIGRLKNGTESKVKLGNKG